MFKMDLVKAEEPEIKLLTSVGSLKKQKSSRKITYFCLFTTPEPLTVWITTNCGKLLRRHWTGLLFPFPRDLPNLGIEPVSLHGRRVLYHQRHLASSILDISMLKYGFPRWLNGKDSACNAEATGHEGSLSGLGRSPWGEHGTHSSILAWEIPWTEEPGGLQSIGPQRVGHS